MRTPLGLAFIAALVAPAGLAAAQPSPGGAPTSSAQVRAEALMAAGKARVEAKDFAGALALFNDAYREYPDPKYFIAIGVALDRLGRDVEAADAYQQYLDSPSPDAVRAVEVRKALATVDARLGKLQIVILGPPTSEFQIGSGAWTAPGPRPVRVPPGAYVVRGRFPGRTPVEITGSVPAGDTVDVSIDLTPARPAPPPVAVTPTPPPAIATAPAPAPLTPTPTVPTAGPAPVAPATREITTETPPAIETAPAPERATPVDGEIARRVAPRTRRWSLFAGAIGAVIDPGVRGLVGVGFQPHARVRLGLDAIIGSSPGIAPRATVYLTTGRLRPALHVGVPVRRMDHLDNPMGRPCGIVTVDGTARVPGFELAAHGGIGVEWQAASRWAVVAEVGYERYLGVDPCLSDASVVTPVVGLIGRL